ncbi:type III-A CRISPR-associated RAMP protein Csm4 [Geminocystis herdmanii]|uniref:type III-A CRISPR-associated RAMP protein Csm4 n=1 Tax=Geminocystis herdmanii TaxID=669359 RepID=UPI000346010B|nr:type III-A CRISPR-associated RAMP protein Csm4 [Geminocystis herdmanii]
MSNWKLIHLNFGKHLAHFGEVGIGLEETQERVKSDTLFSALIISYARLFGKKEVEDLLTQLNQNPTLFRHSSTFIYRRNNDRFTYYLPKPLLFPQNYPVGNDLDFTKTYKKIKYLPLIIWQKWYQKEGFTQKDQQELIDKTQAKKIDTQYLHQQGLFDYQNNFNIQKFPKVAVDRNDSSTNFYHTGFVQYNYENDQEYSGLYFLINFDENTKELEIKICAALHLLAEEGIGGERSSGAGRFTPEWLELPLQWQEIIHFNSGDFYSLMSLFWDSSIYSEITAQSYYEIQERGGWIASPFSGRQLRRKMIRMFTEGSVFSSMPQGELADVTPLDFKKVHTVYRSGISLSLPIQAQLTSIS